jgi:hypothetical protein
MFLSGLAQAAAAIITLPVQKIVLWPDELGRPLQRYRVSDALVWPPATRSRFLTLLFKSSGRVARHHTNSKPQTPSFISVQLHHDLLDPGRIGAPRSQGLRGFVHAPAGEGGALHNLRQATGLHRRRQKRRGPQGCLRRSWLRLRALEFAGRTPGGLGFAHGKNSDRCPRNGHTDFITRDDSN